MKWTLRQKIIISLLTFVILAIPIVYSTYTIAKNVGDAVGGPIVLLTPYPIPTLVQDASFDPADYGLPAQISGYEIMVAVPSESQACALPNTLRVWLHAFPDQPQTLTAADIQQLESIVDRTIQLSFSSGVVSIEQVKSQIDDWNASMASGCEQIGGPIVTMTPTLTPVPTMVPKESASFDPADYGLPPEIGGYQIRAARSWETKFCNPTMDLQLFLYAIPDQPQTLTTADIDELKRITDRPIQLDFVSWPITVEEIKSNGDAANALSCLTLGGPIQDIPNGETNFYRSVWGLPAQISGYEIIGIVVPSGTIDCSQGFDLQITLRPIPEQFQTLTAADIKKLESIVNRRVHIAFSNEMPDVKRQDETLTAATTGICPQNSPIIPPTRDTGSIPSTATPPYATTHSLTPAQNSPIIPPTPNTSAIIAPPTLAG